jgi:hypothetical protein
LRKELIRELTKLGCYELLIDRKLLKQISKRSYLVFNHIRYWADGKIPVLINIIIIIIAVYLIQFNLICVEFLTIIDVRSRIFVVCMKLYRGYYKEYHRMRRLKEF